MNKKNDKELFWHFSLLVNEKNETELLWGYLSNRMFKKGTIDRKLLEEFHVELINNAIKPRQILIKQKVPKLIPLGHAEVSEFRVGGIIPYFLETTDIVIYRKNTEIFRLEVPKEKPSIRLVNPDIVPKGNRVLEWKYTTEAPEYTWFRVFIELDNGKRYPISNFIKTNKVEINFDDLPGCENGRIIVMISDGVWTKQIETNTFRISPKKPILTILYPRNGQKVECEAFLQLNGQGWDVQAQAPIPPDNLRWSIDGKILGTGRLYVLANLTPGKHVISLQAEDSVGISYKRDVEIEAYKGPYPKIVPKKIKNSQKH